MLSNPTSVYQRQRQHRRQKSTPAAYEVPKLPELPTIQRNASHRRGLSLDERARRKSPSRDIKQVSNTNKGFQQKQQILREAQQQIPVRPGQHEQVPNLELFKNENHLISPFVSPQKQNFETSCHNLYGGLCEPTPTYSPYNEQLNATVIAGPNNCSGSDPFSGNDYILFPENGNTTPSSYLDFSMTFGDCIEQQNWGATVKPKGSGRRVSSGIADRVANFESMTTEQPDLRPITPQTQNSGNFLPTPDTTPFDRGCQGQGLEQTPTKYEDPFDSLMEETLRPIRNKGNQRTRNIFHEMRDHAEMIALPSPPGTVPLQTQNCSDSARMPTSSFMNMSSLDMDFMKNNVCESPYRTPEVVSKISPDLSQHSSPEISQMPLLGNPFSKEPESEPFDDAHYLPAPQNSIDTDQSLRRSPQNRSLSVDSIKLGGATTETGITGEDIACYIEGPDPLDQKWLCLYPDCRKRFGRKENIRSHVQTHLGDRQYQCPHCKKCFVRQHDLKRHAKIHSGVKPYPCLCGNSFARHDALTRHRQRGMCIGAFEGVVKKIVKRGRPRKARPGVEERLDKASKTRSKNKATSSSSSTSGVSDSSSSQTPPGDFEILDETPFGDATGEFSQSSTIVENSSFQYSTEHSPMTTGCVSPQYIRGAPSPSALSALSQSSHFPQEHASHRGSITDLSEQQSQYFPSQPGSPEKSHVNYNAGSFNTPPELCLSLSPPPLSSKFYDLSAQSDNQDMDLSRFANFGIHSDDNEDDIFLNAFESRVMSLRQLEEDPGLLLMDGKFEDPFGTDEGGGMFGDDVFFGSP